jgi:hypothetical protein
MTWWYLRTTFVLGSRFTSIKVSYFAIFPVIEISTKTINFGSTFGSVRGVGQKCCVLSPLERHGDQSKLIAEAFERGETPDSALYERFVR